MQDINRITLTAYLTRDPELRSTPGGMSVCSMRIACNTRRKGAGGEWEDKPNYFGVGVKGSRGEAAAANLSKGSRVAIDGRLEHRQYEIDGSKRQVVEIVATDVIYLSRPEPEPEPKPKRKCATKPKSKTEAKGRRQQPEPEPLVEPSPEQLPFDDDIPF